jgi:NifU-like protein involved in Fe-S cluster formation
MLVTPAAEKKYAIGQKGTPGQGPFMTVILTLVGDCITKGQYRTYACPAAAMCGEFMAEWVEGKKLSDIPTFTTEMLLAGTGAMPLGREHCPGLAVDALNDCLVRIEKLESRTSEDTNEHC